MREVVVAGDAAEGGGENGVAVVRASLFSFIVVEIEAAGVVELSERAFDGVGEELVEVGFLNILHLFRIMFHPNEGIRGLPYMTSAKFWVGYFLTPPRADVIYMEAP